MNKIQTIEALLELDHVKWVELQTTQQGAIIGVSSYCVDDNGKLVIADDIDDQHDLYDEDILSYTVKHIEIEPLRVGAEGIYEGRKIQINGIGVGFYYVTEIMKDKKVLKQRFRGKAPMWQVIPVELT